jgi:hypothetical protein
MAITNERRTKLARIAAEMLPGWRIRTSWVMCDWPCLGIEATRIVAQTGNHHVICLSDQELDEMTDEQVAAYIRSGVAKAKGRDGESLHRAAVQRQIDAE